MFFFEKLFAKQIKKKNATKKKELKKAMNELEELIAWTKKTHFDFSYDEVQDVFRITGHAVRGFWLSVKAKRENLFDVLDMIDDVIAVIKGK